MKKTVLLSVFVVLALGINAQTFSLSGEREVKAFNEWVSNLKLQGKDNSLSAALTKKYEDMKVETEIKKASKSKSAYDSLSPEEFKKVFIEDINALAQSLTDASAGYKNLAVVKADNIMRTASAMNSVYLLKIANDLYSESLYFTSLSAQLKKNDISKYDISALKSAAARVKAMEASVKLNKEKLYKEFKGEFNSYFKKAVTK